MLGQGIHERPLKRAYSFLSGFSSFRIILRLKTYFKNQID